MDATQPKNLRMTAGALRFGLFGCALLLGCGSPPASEPPPSAATAGAERPAPKRAPQGKPVEVTGLEGTLSAYDVRDTMERRLEQLGECQMARIRRVRALSGEIELAIHVLRDGSVSRVDVIQSDLGDLETEQCIARVTRETKFPKPHGGEADVKWNMALDPLSRRRPPEEWEADRLAEQLELSLPDTSERCEMTRRSPPITVTAYVAPSGRVIAAGAAGAEPGTDALMACVARDVATWRLPRSKRVGKVTFEARYHRPINDAQRKAIRKKHARRRKAERKREQAEARRRKKRQRAKSRRRRRPSS